MSALKNRLAGLVACLAVTAIVAGVPALLLAIDATPGPSDITWTRLTATDDGTLALVVISVIAWLAWAVMAVSLLAEVIARLRHLPTVELPGLALPQRAAGHLIAVAALLFVALPLAGPSPLAPPANAVSAPTSAPTVAPTRADGPVLRAPVAPAPPNRSGTGASANPATPQATVAYTVQRGDSLWKIAQQRLGDGIRFREIVALNQAALNGQPDFIAPGLILHLPDNEAGRQQGDERAEGSADSYVVKPGDTLSDIADRELGVPSDYPELFDANRHTRQIDGRMLEDPDLILPGWTLRIPGTRPADGSTASATQDETDSGPAHLSHEETPHSTPEPTPDRTSNRAGEGALEPQSRRDADARDTIDSTATATESDMPGLPGWVLPGLTGAGAVLAGSLLIVVRQRRRTQLRFRIPGSPIAPPPDQLRRAEKSAHAAGSLTAPRIEELDRALLSLATEGRPRVLSIHLSTDLIRMTLAEPADLPAPWIGAGTTWKQTITRDLPTDMPTDLPHDITGSASGDVIPPYPLLASVGQADHGTLVLLNLEELRSITLTGDRERCIALSRHLAVELILNPWSFLLEVQTLGIGTELVPIDPARMIQNASSEAAVLSQNVARLASEDSGTESDQFRCVIAALDQVPEHEQTRALTDLTHRVIARAGRSAFAVVAVQPTVSQGSTELRISDDGVLQIPSLNLTLNSSGLTADEATACADLVEVISDTRHEPAGAFAQVDDTTNTDGALASELTIERSGKPSEESSILPKATLVYAQASATRAEDIERLAPATSPGVADRIASTDPDLDDDLARWESPAVISPMLTLLGPVKARTLGDPKKGANRRAFYLELLAYLALHPRGVTAEDVSEAFGLRPERARIDLSILRSWLGTDPQSGEPYLPNARQTHTAGVAATYRVGGVLSDLDLFRRLRRRGQSRGADGIDDLVSALQLVSGEPFTELRETGWSWLLDGDRLDHVMTAAIVDVGHIVTAHALEAEDLDLAQFAARTSYSAAPYDEIARLDLIQVDHALGNHEEADAALVEGILNRSDDALGPVDLPPRTAEILRTRDWRPTRTRSAG